MAGIRQHILPRFLLKGFASRVQDEKIFTRVYRKGGPHFETTIELVQLNAQEIIDQHMPDLQSTLNELIAQMKSLLPDAVRDGHIKSLAKHPAPETRSEGYQSLNWYVREVAEPLILGGYWLPI